MRADAEGAVTSIQSVIRPTQFSAFTLLALSVFIVCVINLSRPSFGDQRNVLSAESFLNIGITITAGQSTHITHQQNGSGFNSLLSAYNSQSSQNSASTTATGSLLSGDSITLVAQNDLGVHGSQVVSTNDVNLVAGGNVSIGTVTETSQTGSNSKSSKKGVFGEGLSTTLGQQKQRLEQLGC